MTAIADYAPPVDTYAETRPMPTIYLMREPITLIRGHVIMLCGMGGVGKGMVVVDAAARTSRGETASGEPGTTIMVTPEDDVQETVAWRLRAADADLRRIIDMTTLDGGAPFRLDATKAGTGSVGQLRAMVDRLQKHDEELRRKGITDPARMSNPLLVVIEPLLATVTAGSIGSDTGARAVIAPLQKLARETGVCVLVSHHMTKGGRDVAGSRAIVNAPRVVYEIVKDPHHDQVAIVTLKKTNIMGTTGGSRYMIAGEGTDAHVVWARPAPGIECTDDEIPGVPDWRARALRGPLTAIDGAQLRPVGAFERMRQGDMVAHLQAMHGGAPDFLQASTLIALHNVRHDADALIPHRHGAARKLLAITAGQTPAGEDDTTREPRHPAAQTEAPPVPGNGAGDRTTAGPRAARASSARGAQPPPPPAKRHVRPVWQDGELVLPGGPTAAEVAAGILDDDVSLPEYLDRLQDAVRREDQVTIDDLRAASRCPHRRSSLCRKCRRRRA